MSWLKSKWFFSYSFVYICNIGHHLISPHVLTHWAHVFTVAGHLQFLLSQPRSLLYCLSPPASAMHSRTFHSFHDFTISWALDKWFMCYSTVMRSLSGSQYLVLCSLQSLNIHNNEQSTPCFSNVHMVILILNFL